MSTPVIPGPDDPGPLPPVPPIEEPVLPIYEPDRPVVEPDPDRLPDEEPLPNPDENPDPPQRLGSSARPAQTPWRRQERWNEFPFAIRNIACITARPTDIRRVVSVQAS